MFIDKSKHFFHFNAKTFPSVFDFLFSLKLKKLVLYKVNLKAQSWNRFGQNETNLKFPYRCATLQWDNQRVLSSEARLHFTTYLRYPNSPSTGIRPNNFINGIFFRSSNMINIWKSCACMRNLSYLIRSNVRTTNLRTHNFLWKRIDPLFCV